jgi:serine/threonine protein kinase
METQQILGDRYELLRRIGVGGMAAVFLAHDRRLDRDVAVKVLDMAGVTDHTFVERFRREARAAAAINHPNVVSIYDWGEVPSTQTRGHSVYFLVMEYVPGPNLKEKIQREGSLSEDESLRIAIQIAAALEAAHARGLIHRDIKSQNVLIDPSGNAKVADFGIAYLEGLTHLTQTNAVSGSAHYISPEQAQGKRVDARTDVYSLGVVLYEMLTGRVPFDGDSLIDVALHHVQDDPIPVTQLRPNISTATETAVATALAKNPGDRFPNAADLRVALERARATSAAQSAVTERRPPPGLVVEQVPRSAPRIQPTTGPVKEGNTVKLGAGVPGRRPRVHQQEHQPRWWLWALPILLLALVGGALAMRSLVHDGTTAAPASTPVGGHRSAARSTAHTGASRRNAVPAATATQIVATSTAVSQPTVPPPTSAPATAPTHGALPAIPRNPGPGSTPSGQPAPPEVRAGNPQDAVKKFYDLVTHHRYAEAATLWSSAMKAAYPPSTNIYGRFDNTQQIDVHIGNVSRQGDTATADVTLAERNTDGTVTGYVGSWNLVRGSSGWLLDSVSLSPAQVSSADGTQQKAFGKGKHAGNAGNQGNG